MVSRTYATEANLSRNRAITTVLPVDPASDRRDGTGNDKRGPDRAGSSPMSASPVATERPRTAGAAFILPSSTLVAQLLAARMDLPQTRTLRRASPDDAEAAYRRTERLDPAPAVSRLGTI